MKKKKDPTASMRKDELQKQLKRKDSAVERLKQKIKTNAEVQARAATIEAALEKVRSRSLAMHQSNEIKDVVKTVTEKISELNIEMNGGVSLVTFSPDSKDLQHWLWIPEQLDDVFKAYLPYFDHIMFDDCDGARKQGLELIAKVYSSEDKQTYFNHLFNKTEFSAGPEEVKAWVYEQPYFGFSYAIQKHSGIFLNDYTGKFFSKETNDILISFSKVFEQAYVRFLDLQKAEAQTREAQIEVALERVRSRTMAMQKTEELNDVIKLIYEQLVHLGLEMSSAGFVMDYKETNDINLLAFGGKEGVPVKVHIPYIDHPICNLFIEAKEKGLDFYPVKLTKEEKDTWFKHIFEQIAGIPEEQKQFVYSLLGYADSHVLTKNVILYIQNYTGIPYTDAENAVLMRFGKVFEQTYTRFTDLRKAEAQARESQIQLALERARTQSMIMQHSNELDDTLRVFHEQVLLLGIKSAFSFLWLPDEEKDRHIFWAAWAENNSTIFKSKAINYPLDRNEPATKQCLIDWKGNDPVVSYHVPPSSVKDYFAAWSELITGVEELKPENFSGGLYYVEAFMKYGCFGVIVKNTLDDDEKKILSRFAIEFERAYTRFLDLQKAEAQTRESQIQLALERVRARTMAMQKSDELSETAVLLFHQLMSLELNVRGCGFNIWEKDEKTCTAWMSGPDGELSPPFNLPLTEDPLFIRYYESRQKGEDFWVYETGKEEMASRYDYLKTLPVLGDAIKKEIEAGKEIPSFVVDHVVNFSNGNLIFITYERCPDEWDIFKRFGKVFEQTYTRFLDLQKAEAQTREAQIEAALEKVRSRSLAMHKSGEVIEVVRSVFERLSELNIELNTAFIIIFKEGSRDTEWWLINKDKGEYSSILVQYADIALLKEVFEIKEQGKEIFSRTYYREEKNELFRYLFTQTDFKYAPAERQKFIFESEAVSISMGMTNKVAIQITRHHEKNFSEADNEIIKRFTKVFDQSYTRFLDLQKAEAQAREAQIETSLERVRSKTMAMHTTNDVGDTVATMFDEFVMLGIQTNRCGILIFSDEPVAEVWTAKSNPGAKANLIIGKLDMMVHPLLQGIFDARKKKESFYTYTMEGKDLQNYYQALNDLEYYPVKFDMNVLPSKEFHSDFYFQEGSVFAFTAEPIPDEVSKVIKRFAAVFGQTYRRYLDLQKAEAQAHEAQIEAALERVRAVAMSMMKSDDLLAICKSVYTQLPILGFTDLRAAQIYIRNDEEEKFMNYDYSDDTGPDIVEVNYNSHPYTRSIYDVIRNAGDGLVHNTIQKKELDEWKSYLYNTLGQKLEKKLEAAEELHYYLYSFGIGAFGICTFNTISNDKLEILKRFRNVFSLAYQRYSDIALAEAQAREAQIELSLERVRAKTMAMHNSQHVADTVATMFDELVKLGVDKTTRSGVAIIGDNDDMEIWTASSHANGEIGLDIGRVALTIHPLMKGFHEAWENKKPDYTYELKGADLTDYYSSLNASPEYPVQFDLQTVPSKLVHSSFFFPEGALFAFSPEPLSTEVSKIFKRFAAVFGQTYRRYLDLKKAEAQAREAQIETGLERVRSRAMAMHKTDELLDAAELVYKELSALGVASMSINYAFVDDEEKNAAYYSINPVDGKIPPFPFIFPHTETEVMRTILAGWKKQEPFNLIELDEEATLKHQTYIGEIIQEAMIKNNINIHFSIEAFLAISPKRAVIYTFNFSKGYLFIIGSARLTKPQEEMVLRFTKVFEMTYRRFLDLKQAEAQAREAKIEASLERVRSKAMAMHSSKDLTDTIIAFYRELESLSVTPRRCGVGLINKETHIAEISSMNTTEQGDSIAVIGNLDLKVHPILKGIYDSWLLQKDYYPVLRGQQIKEYYQILTPQIDYPDYPHDVVQYGYFFFFAEGGVYAWTEKQMTENELKIYKRFTSVLTLTYKRYKDLKQAEEQAREATIEAALERVRGKAMAMRNSDDLSSAASMVFTELRKLGINPIRSGVGIISKESRKVEFYSAMPSANGDSLSLTGGVTMTGHPEFERQYELWLRKENYFTVLKGEELKSYYKFLSAGLNIDYDLNNENDYEQYGHWLMFSEGFLFAWSGKAYSETEINILDRFKKIVELTFRRYIELQKSEINAREAVKQAALDRVRADIASMRTTDDLEKITPLIWNELTILGIPFIRCGVFIMDEQLELIHTFLSTPDGKAIAAFHIPFDTPGNINQVLNHWREKENYIDHWDEKAFTDFADTLVRQGALASPEQYLQTIPHGGFHLHFLPFLQGMLYVGNSKRLGDEAIKLIQSVADAFSTAYARYEDFNKLEAAKQTVEKTLVDLKQAQQQLVQSEKMASLGELTAGIAHEIQNPLNFVNNFSEVSNELIDEMNEELDKGDIAEAKAIANDLKQNLEKINHHGKRADGIVKGMLQHSRSSTNVKELTDINKLADEYLRLCYHGLRAKDKSFNATINADFDHDIEKINIIPQDIGRVILNLLTNAFYAVNEKKKLNIERYEPTVSLNTRKTANQVFISVSDNGGGIPQKIVDKIFQPFFTTKPTGQGTGLGLSLSYDIIIAHGGDIKVESPASNSQGEEEGTKFVITLPLKA